MGGGGGGGGGGGWSTNNDMGGGGMQRRGKFSPFSFIVYPLMLEPFHSLGFSNKKDANESSKK